MVACLLIVCLLVAAFSRSFDAKVSRYTPLPITTSASPCQLPPNGYKAWNQGQLTVIYPRVEKNCSKLIAGDRSEREKMGEVTKNWMSQHSDNNLMESSKDCSLLRDMFSDNLYISQLELSFPIAFNFLVYESPEQFLRLLKVLYRPHNAYCIHPDKKSRYYQFFANIARCFPNIIIARVRIDVVWGTNTLLKAQKSCLTDLAHYRQQQQQKEEDRWKYVINLCGKELPLTSVREMVKKLMSIYAMRRASSVVLVPGNDSWTIARLKGKTLPFNLAYYKSMTYTSLSYPFVHFMLNNPSAMKLYDFMLETDFPEEHFYPTLWMAPGTPGGYNPQIPKEGYFEVGHYFWRTNSYELSFPCFGETIHGICVVSAGDLPRIMDETKNGSTALFQNKYFMELDHVVMDCMEERIVDMNKREYELECSNDINFTQP